MSTKTLVSAEREARKIVHAWTATAAAVGWIPGSMFALAAADVKLVNDVAKAFGVQDYQIEGVTAAVGASVTGKIVAGELLSLLPGFGWFIKSGVAAAITKGVGEAILAYFKQRSPFPAQ